MGGPVARELAAWGPSLGVVSIYLELDPADRGEGWRTRLHNGLEQLRRAAAGAEHERKVALRATADRIEARFDSAEPPRPRAEAGFVEVAAKAGRELWQHFHLAPRQGAAGVHLGAAPVLAPLLDLVRRSRPRAVALVSAERLRLLRWAPGEREELADWELTLFSDDWRERKSPRPSDRAATSGISASGHDRFDQRLEANRERFLSECGRRAARLAGERALGELLAFGSPPHVNRFAEGAGPAPLELVSAGDQDLIAAAAGELEAPIAAATERTEVERERKLALRALDGARGGGRGSAGADETAVALGEGRVEHLLFDFGADGSAPDVEPLIRAALATDAAITWVAPAASGLLADSDGVAALLRY